MDQLINGRLNKISLFYQLKFLSLVEALESAFVFFSSGHVTLPLAVLVGRLVGNKFFKLQAIFAFWPLPKLFCGVSGLVPLLSISFISIKLFFLFKAIKTCSLGAVRLLIRKNPGKKQTWEPHECRNKFIHNQGIWDRLLSEAVFIENCLLIQVSLNILSLWAWN